MCRTPVVEHRVPLAKRTDEMHRDRVDQAGDDDLLPVALVVAECPFMQVTARRHREVRPGCGRLQS
jgi:hypothetical protein